MNRILSVVLMSLILPAAILAQDKQTPATPAESSDTAEFGIIFNMGSILDGIGSYQGGIGIKYHKDDAYWRFLIDLNYDYESGFYSSLLGVNREYYIAESKLSPYFGWGFGTGITYLYTEGTDTTLISVPVNTGAIFGIEWDLTEYISLFVEYAVNLEYTYSSQSSSLYSDDQSSNFTLNTGLGNNGKIGITVYFSSETAKSEETETKIQ